MIYSTLIFFIIAVPIILYFSFKLSEKIKLLDFPDGKRKTHKKPVLLVGGIFFELLFITFFLFYFLFLKSKNFNFSILNFDDFIILSLTLAACFFVGLIDDKKNLNPLSKLSLIFLLFIISLSFLSGDFSLKILVFFFNFTIYLDTFSIIFTSFCFLLLLNAINMADGINSLVSIIFAIWIFFLNIFLSTNDFYFFMNIILIYSLLIFSYLNFKNKCFLGDSGCYVLVTYISFLTVYTYNSNLTQSIKDLNIESIFLLFLVPGIDMFRLFLKRIYKGRNPFRADNNHFHHILRKKFSAGNILIIYSSLIFFPWLCYYLYISLLPYLIIIVLVIYFYLLIPKKEKNEKS